MPQHPCIYCYTQEVLESVYVLLCAGSWKFTTSTTCVGLARTGLARTGLATTRTRLATTRNGLAINTCRDGQNRVGQDQKWVGHVIRAGLARTGLDMTRIRLATARNGLAM